MKLNNKGITFVELMIVAAILGVLAALIVPQFAGDSTQKPTAQKCFSGSCPR